MKFLALLVALIVAIAMIGGCNNTAEESAETAVEQPVDQEEQVVEQEEEQIPEPDEEGYVTLDSGLKYKEIKEGNGDKATLGDTVIVHYKGWLDNGEVFDSSYERNQPFSFTLGSGRVIQGWDQGVKGMKEGGVRELVIPPSLGYGNAQIPGIPPNSTLNFEVKLLEVVRN